MREEAVNFILNQGLHHHDEVLYQLKVHPLPVAHVQISLFKPLQERGIHIIEALEFSEGALVLILFRNEHEFLNQAPQVDRVSPCCLSLVYRRWTLEHSLFEFDANLGEEDAD